MAFPADNEFNISLEKSTYFIMFYFYLRMAILFYFKISLILFNMNELDLAIWMQLLPFFGSQNLQRFG